jgi:hypothetical protein
VVTMGVDTATFDLILEIRFDRLWNSTTVVQAQGEVAMHGRAVKNSRLFF